MMVVVTAHLFAHCYLIVVGPIVIVGPAPFIPSIIIMYVCMYVYCIVLSVIDVTWISSLFNKCLITGIRKLYEAILFSIFGMTVYYYQHDIIFVLMTMAYELLYENNIEENIQC